MGGEITRQRLWELLKTMKIDFVHMCGHGTKAEQLTTRIETTGDIWEVVNKIGDGCRRRYKCDTAHQHRHNFKSLAEVQKT
jgi:hypothetical protein